MLLYYNVPTTAQRRERGESVREKRPAPAARRGPPVRTGTSVVIRTSLAVDDSLTVCRQTVCRNAAAFLRGPAADEARGS